MMMIVVVVMIHSCALRGELGLQQAAMTG